MKIVGKYVYLANNATKKVVKLNKDTGKVEAEHNFSDSCKLDYYADIEYGDDKIYVGYANNKDKFQQEIQDSILTTSEDNVAFVALETV